MAPLRERDPSSQWVYALSAWVLGLGLTMPPIASAQSVKPFVAQPTLSAPSGASQSAYLSNWQYDPTQGRLEVATQGAVRPILFILQNPPRVIVDFPNLRLGRDPQVLAYQGRVQSVQVNQMTASITRFVMSLDPSQPVSLDQMQLLTASSDRWAVQFGSATTAADPVPVAPAPTTPTAPLTTAAPLTGGGALTPPATTPAPPSSSGGGSFLPPPPTVPPPVPATASVPQALPLVPATGSIPSAPGSSVKILSINNTAEGFLVKTTGPTTASIQRITDPDRVVVDFYNAKLPASLNKQTLPINRLGVSRLRLGQFQPTVARVVLEVDPTSGDWETSYDPQSGGVKVYPAGGGQAASLIPDTPSNYQGSTATLQSVTLQGNRLVIAADGFLFYRSGWDPSSGSYRITVSPARLPASIPDPGLPVNGPVERIRFVQEAAQTVSILVQPAREFAVTESAPGQGSRRISLTLNPASRAPVAAKPLPPTTPTLPNRPLIPPGARAIVALDPGHGGRDPGAIGVNGLQEKGLTLAVAQQVAQLLSAKGIGVIMTRTDDQEILLQPRVDTAVANQASIMVSIHANALDSAGVSGIETYYLRPDSQALATTMHRFMVAGTGANDRGIRRARFFMVRETPTTMPSVLLEMGYVTSATEGVRLADPAYQAQLAKAIAQGIEAYLKSAVP